MFGSLRAVSACFVGGPRFGVLSGRGYLFGVAAACPLMIGRGLCADSVRRLSLWRAVSAAGVAGVLPRGHGPWGGPSLILQGRPWGVCEAGREFIRGEAVKNRVLF